MAVKVFFRVLGRGDLNPAAAVPGGPIEAGAAARVAGDARLVDQQQHRVAITVEPHLDQALHLAGCLTFAP